MALFKQYFLYHEVEEEISIHEFSINDLLGINKETIFKLIENNNLQELKNAYILSLQHSNHSFPSDLVLIIQILFNICIIFSPVPFLSSAKFISKLWTTSSKTNNIIIDCYSTISAILILLIFLVTLVMIHIFFLQIKLSKLSTLLKIAITYKKNFLSLEHSIINIKQDLQTLKYDFPNILDQFDTLYSFLLQTSGTTNDLIANIRFETLEFELKHALLKLRVKKIRHSLNKEENVLLKDINNCYSLITQISD